MPRVACAFAVVTALAFCCVLPGPLRSAEGRSLKRFRRAALPQFVPADSAGVFFDDVFSQGVSGAPPPTKTPASAPPPRLAPPPAPALPAAPPTATDDELP